MNGRRVGLVEVSAIWALVAAVSVATVVTYARIPTSELYHVSGSGIAGGLGRALVYVNFPVGIIAAATLPFVAARLPATRPVQLPLVAAALLCAVVAIPGVVDQADLDAKAVNAVPAAGVAVAVAAWLYALRDGIGPREPWGRLDAVRVAAAAVIVVAGLPWAFAEIGVYVSHVPLLSHVFLGAQVKPNPGGAEPTLRAVHLGRHHGMDGTLLALSGLALSRMVGRVRGRALHELAAFAVAALLVYGVLNASQDFWFEQVVKRGWTDASLPSFLRPGVTWAWLLVVGGTVAVYAVVRRSAGGELRHHA